MGTLATPALTLCTGSGAAGGSDAARMYTSNWRAAILLVATSKTRRGDLLPIPATVRHAIAIYLKNGRPETADEDLFVRHYLPVGAPLRANAFLR
jgi:hypothetical protein